MARSHSPDAPQLASPTKKWIDSQPSHEQYFHIHVSCWALPSHSCLSQLLQEISLSLLNSLHLYLKWSDLILVAHAEGWWPQNSNKVLPRAHCSSRHCVAWRHRDSHHLPASPVSHLYVLASRLLSRQISELSQPSSHRTSAGFLAKTPP